MTRFRRPSYSLEPLFSFPLLRRLIWLAIGAFPLMLAVRLNATMPLSNMLPLVSLTYGLVAGLAAYRAIPVFASLLAHAGRTGKDLNKPQMPVIPESLGIAVGTRDSLEVHLFHPLTPFY